MNKEKKFLIPDAIIIPFDSDIDTDIIGDSGLGGMDDDEVVEKP